MNRLNTLALIGGTAFLAGCISGGGGSSLSFDFEGPISISELNDASRFVFDQDEAAENGDVTLVSEADLIAKGSATYNGYMLAGIPATEDAIVGRADIDATFTGGGSLTGSVTNMQILPGSYVEEELEPGEEFVFEPIPSDVERYDLDGSLALADGEVGTSEGSGGILMTMFGNVTVPAEASFTDAAETYAIDGDFLGGVTNTDTFVAIGLADATGDAGTFEIEAVIVGR